MGLHFLVIQMLSEYFDVGQIKQPTTWENHLIFIRKDINKLHLTRND
jgi:hypothetical protein